MSSSTEYHGNGKNGHTEHLSNGSPDPSSASKRLKVAHSTATSEDPSQAPTEVAIDPSSVAETNLPPVDESNIFGKFTLKKVLKADPSKKIVFVHGRFDGDEEGKDAVLILEQMAVGVERLGELFASRVEGKLEFQNDVYHNYRLFLGKEFCATKTTIIYPATRSHIEKFGQQLVYILDESPEDYQTVTLPQLQKSKRFDTKWVDNILDHEKETDRIVFEDPDKETGFVLLPDLKWDGRNVECLYLIALIHKRGIHSIRDLTGQHLDMLRKLKSAGTAAITKKYGLPASRIRAFLHYQPTFYHLHIHFTNNQFDAPGRNAEKAHMLTTVISNLAGDTDYYKRATIPFLVGEKDPLYPLYAHRLKPEDKTE